MDCARLDFAIEGPLPAGERILACVGPHPNASTIVRTAKRLADLMDAPWIAVTVERPGGHLQEPERRRVGKALKLAESLGGETMTVVGNDVAGEILRIARFENATQIVVSGGNEACYRPGIDTIFIPPFERFVDAASHYSCLGHEAAHATGARHRLDRDLTGRFGSAKYAMDDVVCELTSSFVTADFGIAHRPRPEHAAYIASWLQVLKDDPRAIFTAASKAQQAADWMHAQQPAATAIAS